MSERLGWGQGERKSCGEGRNGGRTADLGTWSSHVLGFSRASTWQDPDQAPGVQGE